MQGLFIAGAAAALSGVIVVAVGIMGKSRPSIYAGLTLTALGLAVAIALTPA